MTMFVTITRKSLRSNGPSWAQKPSPGLIAFLPTHLRHAVMGHQTGPAERLDFVRPALIRGFLIYAEPPALWFGTRPL